MELASIVFSATIRLFGFLAIIIILSATVFVFAPISGQYFLFLFSLVLLAVWKIYGFAIGSLENDLAVLIRLLSIKGVGLFIALKELVDKINEIRFPSPGSEYAPLIVEWSDVETTPFVRRKLRSGRLPILLGQYDGVPQIVDLANDIGKLYISAPDRTGKTSLIKEVITSILLGHPMAKSEIDFVFVDITRDLAVFKPLGRYTHDMREAIKILRELGEDVERRNKLREKHRHADWWWEIPVEERPKIVLLVIDEAIQVLKEGGDSLQKAWSNLINVGWKVGVLMITTTLYTRGDLIPTEFTALMRGRVVGCMSTRQGYINVVEADYFERWKEQIEGFVNQRFHFALCIRGGLTGKKDAPPILFRTIFVPKERLMQLVEDAVIDPADWRSVVLSIWFNERGNIGAEQIAERARAFVISRGSMTKPEVIHKKSVLETLRYATVAKISVHNGERHHYAVHEDVTSLGVLLERWGEFTASGGLKLVPPTPEELNG